jgi:hypothetical protein
MSVAAFLLLAMNILVIKKPTFSQLTSSVFGLFYCGESLRTTTMSRSTTAFDCSSTPNPAFAACKPSTHMISVMWTSTAFAWRTVLW